MLIPDKEEKIEHTVGTGKGINISGDVLSIENGALKMEIDISSGMKLTKMQNDFI